MAFLKATSPRRREVRRNLPRSKVPPLRVRGSALAWVAVFVLAMGLGASFVAPGIDEPSRYAKGLVLREAIVPRVEFRAVDVTATQRRKEDAAAFEPAAYVPNDAFFQKVREGLANLLALGGDPNITSIDQIPVATMNALYLNEAALRELRRINADPRERQAWNEKVEQLVMRDLPSIAILDHERFVIESDPSDRATRIAVMHPTLGELVLSDRFDYFDIAGDLMPVRRNITRIAAAFPPVLQRSVIAIVMEDLKPTYFFNQQETARRREAAADAQKEVETVYRANTVLVPAGTTLGEREIRLLNKEHQAYLAQFDRGQLFLMRSARLGLMLLITAAVWVYIIAYKPMITRNPLRGLAITVLLLACQAAAVVGTAAKPELLYLSATFPTLLAAIVLAIAYDQRFALAIGAIHALLVTVSLQLPVEFAIMLLVGVGVGVGWLDEIRTRSKLVVTGAWVGFAMACTALINGFNGNALAFEDGLKLVFTDALLVLGSGTLTGIFVQGVLPGIERLFRVTTAMTLKELNDASLPLLRRLAEEAPGTYQHSLRIADMAESAAEIIEADGLMCRVGAMYHDIGKINKPAYFVENQGGGPNRHNKLSPAMSLLIIVGHVKDGMEMAREYGLPPVLRHFIESHHGTTLVEYFYHAARQQKRDAIDARDPAEFTFRYPGPKPQTKEAAILMLCDGLEGAARTLPEPTPVRLEQLVHTMAMKRLMDGQFDECSLTLQELHKIEQAITRTLCAIYHARIAYPKGDEREDEKTPEASSDMPRESPPEVPRSAVG